MKSREVIHIDVACNIISFTIFFPSYAGHKYYYNRKTHVSQWEHPNSLQKAVSQRSESVLNENVANMNWDSQTPVFQEKGSQCSHLERCMGCGGWGVGLLQVWGYCNHCTR